VLLKIVTFTANVGDHFKSIRQSDLGDLTESRVRLLRRAGHDLKANTAPLRALGKRRRLRLHRFFRAAVSDELIDGGHGLKNFRS